MNDIVWKWYYILEPLVYLVCGGYLLYSVITCIKIKLYRTK